MLLESHTNSIRGAFPSALSKKLHPLYSRRAVSSCPLKAKELGKGVAFKKKRKKKRKKPTRQIKTNHFCILIRCLIETALAASREEY